MTIRLPVIPTNIIVHLGAPDDNSRNVTVPFTEYIKNVASGELYPNWPIETIKANVLAQISFALNRIYNEWYPSKGYDFDITSSPLYDQNFSLNRQFFETTANVVDELFNNYIVKDDQVQPLFARYCDGRKSKCEGLSQWGSVSLANNGKNYLDILKYYYGNDIRIIQNAPVSDDIKTYPGFPIEIGASGNFVRMLNNQLNRIGQNYPAIPVITNNSDFFTVETENAVKKFQEIFDLKVNGIVDKATWYKIKYIYNAVKKISDLYSEGISMYDVMFTFNNTLKIGDNGKYIRVLNYYLNVISYFDNSILFMDLDGDEFTSKTREVVSSFQKKYGINATGIVDSNTWKYIREVYNKTIKDLPSEYYNVINEFFPDRFLSRGMKGQDIVNLQSFLYKICKNSGSIPGVVVNGEFDSLTEQSVKKLQKDNNLDVNGVVGPVLWNIIVTQSKIIK